jgi:hypothetical protein
VTELVAHPWNRYGHRRLYLKTPEGAQVGWVDCLAEAAHLEDVAYAADFATAVSRIIPTQPEVATVAQPRMAGDLALNHPGLHAAEVERAERDASPIYSRLARLFDLDTAERAWRVGRKGEEAVAVRLARLPSQWQVLHSIEIGTRGGDIDHLVIGPGGVYTINAKHHPDACIWVGGDCFMVNGHRQPYVRNSRHEAIRAARILTQHAGFAVPVVGVIAVMGARRGFVVKEQPVDERVFVVTRKQIDAWLRCRKPILSSQKIATIYDIARRPHIWLG